MQMEQKQEQWTALKEAVDGEWIAQMAHALVEIPSVDIAGGRGLPLTTRRSWMLSASRLTGAR